jgi:hypothetical protein
MSVRGGDASAPAQVGTEGAEINGGQLTHALAGMPYPARRWQTITWAEYNCASEQLLKALRYLPKQDLQRHLRDHGRPAHVSRSPPSHRPASAPPIVEVRFRGVAQPENFNLTRSGVTA